MYNYVSALVAMLAMSVEIVVILMLWRVSE